MTSRRAVFFDRDGVLNKPVQRAGNWVAPRSVAEFELYEDVGAAVQAVRDARLATFVITNQPDIARGFLAQADLDAMMASLDRSIAPDDMRCCPHDDMDGCNCRKPKPGMITDLATRWNVDLKKSFVVGDSWRDIDAGHSVGCRTIFVDRRGEGSGRASPDVSVGSLAEAATYICNSL